MCVRANDKHSDFPLGPDKRANAYLAQVFYKASFRLLTRS